MSIYIIFVLGSLGVHMKLQQIKPLVYHLPLAATPPRQLGETPSLWLILALLLFFLICTIASFLLSSLAKTLFPKFRSGEHKPGNHRPDLPTTGREIKTIELPLVGGPSFILAIVGTGLGAAYFLQFSQQQWTLLLIALGATVGYALVGFIDDWRKVYHNSGISEHAKFTGVFLVGCIAAALYFFLLPNLGQQSYSIWKDLPILNTILCAHSAQTTTNTCSLAGDSVSYYSWLIFLVLLTGCVGSATSICVDFSDGLDGLAGGLVFS